jgi:hypothetical protein
VLPFWNAASTTPTVSVVPMSMVSDCPSPEADHAVSNRLSMALRAAVLLLLAVTPATATRVYGEGGGVVVLGLGLGVGLGLAVVDGDGDGTMPEQGAPLMRQLLGLPSPLVLNPNDCDPPAATVAL